MFAPDSFLYTSEYAQFLKFRKNKIALLFHQPVDTTEVVQSNPDFYDAYRIAGDYCMEKGWYRPALNYYQQALRHEVATIDERKAIREKILECRDRLEG